MRHYSASFLGLAFALIHLLVPPSLADDVTIQWEADPRAAQYELEVVRGSEVIFDKLFPAGTTAWASNLRFGTYAYRLRSYDRSGRASPWSDPIPFVATPAPPRPILPLDKSTVLYQRGGGVPFKWSSVQGAETFVIIVKGGAESFRQTVRGTEVVLSGLTPGEYAWQVKPVLQSTSGLSEVLDIKASTVSHFHLDLVRDATKYDLDFQMIELLPPKSGIAFPPHDYVCLTDLRKPGAGPVACGKISSAQEHTVKMELLVQSERIEGGNRYYLSSPDAPDRTPGSLPNPESAYEVVSARSRFNFDVSAGVMVGANYFFPAIEIQTAVLPSTVLGLRAISANDSNASSALQLKGGLLTLGHFIGQRNYSGFFGELGAGAAVFSATSGNASQPGRVSLLGELSFGWQLRPAQQGFNVSFSAGTQYLQKPRITIVDSGLNGWLPLITALFGYSF